MAFGGKAKEQTRVVLHPGGRDLDIWLEGGQVEALTTAQLGMTGDKCSPRQTPSGNPSGLGEAARRAGVGNSAARRGRSACEIVPAT